MRYLMVVLALSGCVATPDNLQTLNPAGLCHRYGDAPRRGDGATVNAVRGELSKRRITAPDPVEIGQIMYKQVHVGMTQSSAIASWGMPIMENRTTTASGTRIQHVWRGPFRGANYLYTENGRIVAIQN